MSRLMNRVHLDWQKIGIFWSVLGVLLSGIQASKGDAAIQSEGDSLRVGSRQVEWKSTLGFTRHALPQMGGSWIQGQYRGADARVWIASNPLSSAPGLAAVRLEWSDALKAQKTLSPEMVVTDSGCVTLPGGGLQCSSDGRTPASAKRPQEFLSQTLTWYPERERVLLQSRTYGSMEIARALLAEFRFGALRGRGGAKK